MKDLELNIVDVPITDLVPYAKNANIHSNTQIDQIANSISEFGFIDPVGIWENPQGELEIVEGHGRVLAAKRLGYKELPVIYLNALTDEQRRAYTHVHNQLTRNSEFDEGLLLQEIEALDFDWRSLGFDIDDDTDPGELVEDEVPAIAREDKSKKGQIWQLGDHRLVCGDSTDPKTIEKLMDGDQADLLLTDPPYNVALGHHMRPSEAKQLHRRTDGLVIDNDAFETEEEFEDFLVSAYEAALPSIKPGAAFYIWHASTMSHRFKAACTRAGMQVRQTLVWNKNTFALGRQDYQWKHEPCLYGWKDGAAHYFIDDRTKTTVEEIQIPDLNKATKSELIALCNQLLAQADNYSSTVIDEDKPSRSVEHPTMKPVKLLARQIANSTKRDWVVLDPFGGSGSTLMACEQMGRKCYTAELDPHYCDVIIQRWEDFTGQEAVLLDG